MERINYEIDDGKAILRTTDDGEWLESDAVVDLEAWA